MRLILREARLARNFDGDTTWRVAGTHMTTEAKSLRRLWNVHGLLDRAAAGAIIGRFFGEHSDRPL